MGSEYRLLKKDSVEVDIFEMSNRFPLNIGDYGIVLRDLSEKEVLELGLRCLQVVHYYSNSDYTELRRYINNWLEQNT
jgi:hypothetical protein